MPWDTWIAGSGRREERVTGPEKAVLSGVAHRTRAKTQQLVPVRWIPEAPGGHSKPGGALRRGLPKDTCPPRYPLWLQVGGIWAENKGGYTFKERKNTGEAHGTGTGNF